MECTNHALKNYGKHLRSIKSDTGISLAGRKLLTLLQIKKLTKRAKCSIYEHAKNGQNIELLQMDLINGLHHVYGDHSKCREEICNNIGDDSNNKISQLKASLIYNHIKGSVNLLAKKAHLLIANENNNAAERLMNIVARFNMGKRLNLIQRNSYGTRVYLAVLRYNSGHNWSISAWKTYSTEVQESTSKNSLLSNRLRLRAKLNEGFLKLLRHVKSSTARH
ncbi:hypothetical protein PPYR_00267 [Photinus pyralis]|uniref:Mutator-like transposase domain-containing protein n=1 Tax=Photinus pyralis TaxID=7054 RepID=A0A5N4B126_PHOPY|nr:hypothetical protein PPYR_00267 [Photinus pyralis]